MMLWSMLRHFDRRRFQAGLICFQPGELLSDLPPDVPAWVAPYHLSSFQKMRNQLGFSPVKATIRRAHREFKPDVWYLNTMTLPETLALAPELGVPLITHFHEMPLSYAFINATEMQQVVTYSSLLIGCSEATSEGIRQAGGGEKVATLHSFIDTSAIKPAPARARELRASLGIPEGDFVWVMSGTTSERKGFDLWPDLALLLNDPHIHLVWLGSRLDNGSVWYTERRCAGVFSTKIHLVGKQEADYHAYLEMADGFVLTSRQDPFPLVMIEAAYLGLPVVSFPSGGVSEFVQPGMGEVVDSWNLPDLVAAMRRVMTHQTPFDAGVAKQRAARFDVARQLPRWEELLSSFTP